MSERLYKPNTATKFQENGEWFYLDPVRYKQVLVTPEETVRQDILQYLLDDVGVPPHKILVEVPLDRFKKYARGRADIVITVSNPEDEDQKVLCIIECKRANIDITDQTFEQARAYAEICDAEYIICTNGEREEAYQLKNDEYVLLNKTPTYLQMLNGDGEEYEYDEPVPDRPMEDVLKDTEYFKDIGVIGEHSAQIVEQTGIKLYESFVRADDCTGLQLGYATVEEDYGVVYWTVGNNALGYTMLYRVICVCYKGMHRHIFLGTAGMVSGSKTSTILVVGIQDRGPSRMGIMLNLDKGISVDGDIITIRHSGRLARAGRTGLRQQVFDILKETRPDMLGSNEVIVGTLDGEKLLWDWDDKRFCEFIGNLIEYAIIRDKVGWGVPGK